MSFVRPKSFPAKGSNGLFEYCACQLLKCKANVVTSVHACRTCKRRMDAQCLVEEGTFGLCYKCFHRIDINSQLPSKTNQNTDQEQIAKTIKKMPLNSRPVVNTIRNPTAIAVAGTKRPAPLPKNEDNDVDDDEDDDEDAENAPYDANDSLFNVIVDKGLLVPPTSKVVYRTLHYIIT